MTLGPLHSIGYTYQQAGGNRQIGGSVNLGDSPQVIDIPLPAEPRWLVAVTLPPAADPSSATAWVTVLEDGTVHGFNLDQAGGVSLLAVEPARIDPDMVPIVAVEISGALKIANISTGEQSSTGATGILSLGTGRRAFIKGNGDLVIQNLGDEDTVLAVNAMSNARVLSDGLGRVLFLSGPNDRYGHDVLGGSSVSSGVVLVDTTAAAGEVMRIALPNPDVFEGNALIWSDLDGDGVNEIITTRANSSVGTWLTVHDETGAQLARSAAVGRGSRWRHLLGAVATGGAGKELAATLRPHIDAPTEFYSWADQSLNIRAAELDLTSHRNGTANIDIALIGDFNGSGDGVEELIIVDQDFERLGVVSQTANGPLRLHSLGLGNGNDLRTNLAGVSDADGRIWVGAGHDGDGLRIWH